MGRAARASTGKRLDSVHRSVHCPFRCGIRLRCKTSLRGEPDACRPGSTGYPAVAPVVPARGPNSSPRDARAERDQPGPWRDRSHQGHQARGTPGAVRYERTDRRCADRSCPEPRARSAAVPRSRRPRTRAPGGPNRTRLARRDPGVQPADRPEARRMLALRSENLPQRAVADRLPQLAFGFR